jgi:hypothetical protein
MIELRPDYNYKLKENLQVEFWWDCDCIGVGEGFLVYWVSLKLFKLLLKFDCLNRLFCIDVFWIDLLFDLVDICILRGYGKSYTLNLGNAPYGGFLSKGEIILLFSSIFIITST